MQSAFFYIHRRFFDCFAQRRMRVTGPGEIFRNARGIDFCRRYMRYCIARWGYSSAVNSLLLTVW